jgi:hypothetical protein
MKIKAQRNETGHSLDQAIYSYDIPSLSWARLILFPMDNSALLKANIIDLLGLEGLPEEKKQALLAQMGAVVEDRVMDRVLSRLNETQKLELDQILQQDSAEAVEAFLAKNASDMNTLMQEEILRMKTEMPAQLEHMKSAVGQA